MVCVHVLSIVSNAAMNMGAQNIVETLLPVVLDTYPEVELLSHTVIIFLIFLGTPYCA